MNSPRCQDLPETSTLLDRTRHEGMPDQRCFDQTTPEKMELCRSTNIPIFETVTAMSRWINFCTFSELVGDLKLRRQLVHSSLIRREQIHKHQSSHIQQSQTRPEVWKSVWQVCTTMYLSCIHWTILKSRSCSRPYPIPPISDKPKSKTTNTWYLDKNKDKAHSRTSFK